MYFFHPILVYDILWNISIVLLDCSITLLDRVLPTVKERVTLVQEINLYVILLSYSWTNVYRVKVLEDITENYCMK